MNKEMKKTKIVVAHPKFYTYKIYLPDDTYFETITTKQNEKFKENFFRLEIMQSDHPAWTGNIFNKVFTNKNNARTKNTNIFDSLM